jgi:hypothetical protein
MIQVIRKPGDQFGLMLRSPLSLSFETAFGLLRMRLKGCLEAEAELIIRNA